MSKILTSLKNSRLRLLLAFSLVRPDIYNTTHNSVTTERILERHRLLHPSLPILQVMAEIYSCKL